MRHRELADSYLDHVLLILRVNDGGARLRDFLDPWWSFTRGAPFVTQRDNGHHAQHTLDNPCPRYHGIRLSKLDWISQSAAEALKRNVAKKGRDKADLENAFMVDHAVPLSLIRNHLFAHGREWSIETLREYLTHHYKRGLLTRAEDARLNAKIGRETLKAAMPKGWKPWGDPFARYEARQIAKAA